MVPWPLSASWHFSFSSYCQLHSSFWVSYFQFSTEDLIHWAHVLEPGQTTEYWQTYGLAAIDSAWGRHLVVLIGWRFAQKLWMSPFLSEGKCRLSYYLSVGFIFLNCASGNTISLEIRYKDIAETLFITLYSALFMKTPDINVFLALVLEIIVQLFMNWSVYILLTLWWFSLALGFHRFVTQTKEV